MHKNTVILKFNLLPQISLGACADTDTHAGEHTAGSEIPVPQPTSTVPPDYCTVGHKAGAITNLPPPPPPHAFTDNCDRLWRIGSGKPGFCAVGFTIQEVQARA
jgi:hypothetical protein